MSSNCWFCFKTSSLSGRYQQNCDYSSLKRYSPLRKPKTVALYASEAWFPCASQWLDKEGESQ